MAKLVIDIAEQKALLAARDREIAGLRREIAVIRPVVAGARNMESRLTAVEHETLEATLAHGAELSLHEYQVHHRERDEVFGGPRYTHRQGRNG